MKSLVPVAFIFLLLVLGCGGLKNNPGRSSSGFDPFTGNLSDLLKPEIPGASLKFKLVGTRDLVAQHPGAKEAKGFTYNQEGAGVSIQVDGLIVNFPSSQQAETRLREIAAQVGVSPVKKGQGQRFSAKGGEEIGWTNGSVMCLVKSQFARPAGNFEEAVPF